MSEWCLDIYDRTAYRNYDQSLTDYDPLAVDSKLFIGHGPATGRVYRGGNFSDTEVRCHVCLRRDLDETASSDRVGFRPVLLLELSDSMKDVSE